MADTRKRGTSRRGFLSTAGKGIVLSSVAGGFPAIVPSTVLGAAAPSNRINVGAIGMGRISRTHDLPGIWKHEGARVVAACDLDSNRVADAKTLINGQYSQADRKAVRRRDGVRRLSRAARQPRHRRGRHQYARPLAHDHRRPRGRSGEGRVPAEAGLADDHGRTGAQQRRPQVRPHFPDRQPAAIVAAGAVPQGVRARSQRPDRPAADRRSGAARRSIRRGRARDARSEESQLRRVAGIHAGRALHGETRPSAESGTGVQAGCAASSSAPA